MVETGDGEHADEIESGRHGHRWPAPTHPDHGQAGNMKSDEGNDPDAKVFQRTDFIEITEENGEQVINGFLILKDTIGKGAFCKVKRAIGKFNDDNEEEYEEEYAVKIYNKKDLKRKKCTYYDKEGLV